MTVPTRPLYAYEQSSEAGRERHVRIPYARLKDITPTIGDPACVTSVIVGMETCGTVITVNATNETAIINFAEGALCIDYVYNISVWNADDTIVGATFAPINVGDPVFYDEQADALGHGKLSIAQFMADGTTPKPRFGTVELLQDEDCDDFPKGDEQAGTYNLCAIMQTGLNSVFTS